MKEYIILSANTSKNATTLRMCNQQCKELETNRRNLFQP